MIRLLTRVILAGTLLNLLAHVEGQACNARPTMTPKAIHAGTTEDNAWEIIGLGGRYGYLSSTFLSKLCLVESDHFPPKSAYKWARHNNIRNIPERDMAAVTVSHSFHDSFFTTKNNLESQCIMERYFQAGNYYGAIDQNIQWYVTNPARTTGIKRQGNLAYIKEGIEGGLRIHVKNGLITEDQSRALLSKHFISYKMNLNLFLLTVPRRDAARTLIQCNTGMYTHVRNMSPMTNPTRSACEELIKQGRTGRQKPVRVSKECDPNSRKRTGTAKPNQGTIPKTKRPRVLG